MFLYKRRVRTFMVLKIEVYCQALYVDLETLVFLQKQSAKAEQDNKQIVLLYVFTKNLNFNK